MDPFVVRLPTEEEEEQAARFRTYLNYLTSIRDYLQKQYADPALMVDRIVNSKDYCRIQGGRASAEELLKLLRNAWFTEIQMHIVAPDDELGDQGKLGAGPGEGRQRSKVLVSWLFHEPAPANP